MESPNLVFESIIIIISLLLVIVHTILYLIKNKLLVKTINQIFDMFRGTYSYSLKFLTVIFLISYYGELAARIFYSRSFTMTMLFTTNPNNVPELILYTIFILVCLGSIVFWTNRVLNVATNYILNIQYSSGIATFTVRIFASFLYICFQAIILIPLFSYGLAGIFGIP